jgi:Reverse transcriptase (RNA-dependent DNA polymerase)
MERLYTTREVKRSAIARRFQAALGFPPDAKMISATRSGTFLNSDVLPEDILRATHMWGPCLPGLKGRTTRERPMPPPQGLITTRRESAQHMHCDLMFINKQPYLVSLTQPAGIYQTSCIDNIAAPTLRVAIRRMFGNLNARRIDVVRFTSDNEKGIASLFGDMSGMGVQAITVGSGQHDHIIERAIRYPKETVRATIASLPFLVPDCIMAHLVVSCTRKIMLFPSTTRTDRISPFEVYYGRKADAKGDIGLPFGTYCQVPRREMTSGMEPRTLGCIYLEPRMNGSGSHNFMCLKTKAVIAANHMTPFPFPPLVVQYINDWAGKNKLHTRRDPVFTYHDQDITLHPADDDDDEEPRTTRTLTRTPPQFDGDAAPDLATIPPTPEEPTEISPDDSYQSNDAPVTESDTTGPPADATYYPTTPTQEKSVSWDKSVSETSDDASNVETGEELMQEENETTQQLGPREPPVSRQPSTRIRRPVIRLNLLAESDPSVMYANLTASRLMRLFPEKTTAAMEGEVRSLLSKQTFSGVLGNTLTYEQRRKVLRSNMNVIEKYLPTLDSTGNRAIDKVKARLCVDGRAQDRADYLITEIEAPTASTASIFTIAQIAAAEKRHVMVGDVGTAYLNARMPDDDLNKAIHMSIDSRTAAIVVEQDPTFKRYLTKEGGLIVRLDKALYGCIQSARLWNDEITRTLVGLGFEPNPRDRCVFNAMENGVQTTIVVYVDDLMVTSVNEENIHRVDSELRNSYGQFRTTEGKELTYLGCTWDYTSPGLVHIRQTGMIQDLVMSRERTHAERKCELKDTPCSPHTSSLFDRTHDSTLLSEEHAKTYHKDVATALFLGNRTRPDIVLALGELCKRVKAPTMGDDKKLDRMIAFLRATRDTPLTLGCTTPPIVTVSIDAAFHNREEQKSTSGVAVTLGTGVFITSSKVQKLVTKSSTEAEIVAVSDGMNLPLWLRDFITYQGYVRAPVILEQDNMSCITMLQKGESTAQATKYIDVRMFWVSDYIKRGEVTVQYVSTEEMTSDYYTKPLTGGPFMKMWERIMGCTTPAK